jgi:hypothetical protein
MNKTEVIYLFFGVSDKDLEVITLFKSEGRFYKVAGTSCGSLPSDTVMELIMRWAGNIFFPPGIRRGLGPKPSRINLEDLLGDSSATIFYVEPDVPIFYYGSKIKYGGHKAVKLALFETGAVEMIGLDKKLEEAA